MATYTAEDILEQRDWLRNLARNLMSDEFLVEDLVQETMRAGIEGLHKITNLRAYLRAAMRNIARTLWHRRGRSWTVDGTNEALGQIPGPEPAPDQLLIQREVGAKVVEHVLALEEPLQTVLLCRFFEGLSDDETAARLGIPEETVRTRIHRALKRLRARMKEEDFRGGTLWGAIPWLARGAPEEATAGTVVAAATKGAHVVRLAVLAFVFAGAAALGLKLYLGGDTDGNEALAATELEPHSGEPEERESAAAGVLEAIPDLAVARLRASEESDTPPPTTFGLRGIAIEGHPRGSTVGVPSAELNVSVYTDDDVGVAQQTFVITTGPDGSFVFNEKTTLSAATIWISPVDTVSQWVPHSSSTVILRWTAATGAPTDVVIPLFRRDTLLRVTVVDTEENPVFPAAVEHFSEIKPTDAAGEVTFFTSWRLGAFDIFARAPGLAQAKERVLVQGMNNEQLEARLELKPGTTLQGTVTDTSSRPLEGATLVMMDVEQGEIHATTDEDGIYNIPHVDAGLSTVVIEALCAGFVTKNASMVAVDGVLPAIVMRAGRDIEIHVTGNGSPLSSVRAVLARGGADSASLKGWTDEHGILVFEESPTEALFLFLQYPGYAARVVQVGEKSLVSVTLEEGRNFTTQVVDAAGRPLSNVMMRVSLQGFFLDPESRSDAAGSIQRPNMPDGDVELYFSGPTGTTINRAWRAGKPAPPRIEFDG